MRATCSPHITLCNNKCSRADVQLFSITICILGLRDAFIQKPVFMYILFSSTCTIVYIFNKIGYRKNFVIYPCTRYVHFLCNKSL